MNLSLRLRIICPFLLALLLLVGCSPTREIQDLVFTFHGESCQYEGPEVIREGTVVIEFDNPTNDEFVHLHLTKLDEGKTWQDFVQYIGGVDASAPLAPWEKLIAPTSVDGDTGSVRHQARYFREWEFSLTSGLHTIVCARHAGVVEDVPNGIWPGAPIEVRP